MTARGRRRRRASRRGLARRRRNGGFLGSEDGADLPKPVADRSLTKGTAVQEAVDLLWTHPQVRDELRQLLAVLDERVDHLHQPLTTHPDAPLQIHARYTRIEILAAMGTGAGAKIAELLAVTPDKSSGGFSPTTRYSDDAISRTLIHWESQSVTRADSATGLRYATTSETGGRSCSSLGSGPTTAPSGSSARPATSATKANARWRSRGRSTTRSPATSF